MDDGGNALVLALLCVAGALLVLPLAYLQARQQERERRRARRERIRRYYQ